MMIIIFILDFKFGDREIFVLMFGIYSILNSRRDFLNK